MPKYHKFLRKGRFAAILANNVEKVGYIVKLFYPYNDRVYISHSKRRSNPSWGRAGSRTHPTKTIEIGRFLEVVLCQKIGGKMKISRV